MRRAVFTAWLCALATPAIAQDDALLDEAKEHMESALDAADLDRPPERTLGGELGFGKIDEDIFLTMLLRFNFDQSNWGIGFSAPLRFTLIDFDPEDEGAIRGADWDDPADFFKLIRYAYVGQRDKKGPYYARVGDLGSLTVGHGTIVDRYTNGNDIDTFRFGANFVGRIEPFGAEVVVADLARIQNPVLAGVRVFGQPLELLAPDLDPVLKRFTVGASLMSDPAAPFELQVDADGDLVLDDDGDPIPTRERALMIFGLDFGIEVVRTALLKIEPYFDVNVMTEVDQGLGLHLGVLWSFGLPVLIDDLVIDLRTEYRRVSGDYRGPYFDTIYEIERMGGFEGNAGAFSPKLRRLADRDIGARNGLYFDLLAGLPDIIFVGGEFVDYDGGQDDGTLRLSLHVPFFQFLDFSAVYYRTQIGGASDLIAIDDRSLVVAEARIPVYWMFTANVRWWRVWNATPDGYESVDDWSISLGFKLDL